MKDNLWQKTVLETLRDLGFEPTPDKSSKKETEYMRGKQQYSSTLYWYHVDFSPEEKEKIRNNKNYREVTGFNVMPYTITKTVVAKAVDSKKKDCKPCFNEIIKNKPKYCDYDPETGNFHKKIDFSFQIVLTKEKSNPKWKNSRFNRKGFNENQTWEFRKELINTQFYFPRIDNSDERFEKIKLKELIEQVINEIGITPRKKNE